VQYKTASCWLSQLYVDSCLMLARQVKYQVKTQYTHTYRFCIKCILYVLQTTNTVAVQNLLAISKRYGRLLVQCKLSREGENWSICAEKMNHRCLYQEWYPNHPASHCTEGFNVIFKWITKQCRY